MAQNVLLIPKGFLGDILLTTPVVAAISRGIPGAHIAVVCTPKTVEFVRRDPLVHSVIVYDRHGAHRGWRGLREFVSSLRARDFDVAYSFHASPRTAIALWMAGIRKRVGFAGAPASFLYTRKVPKLRGAHDVVRNLSLVITELDEVTQKSVEALRTNPSADIPWADLRVPSVDQSRVGGKVADPIGTGERYVVVAPGSAWETKRWDASRYKELVSSLTTRGTKVVIVGAQEDAAVCGLVANESGASNVCGETSIEELIALIKNAACVVCNDSFALHICSATKTPAVAIFCATSPRFGFGPWRSKSVVLERGELFCKPCHRHGGRRCPHGTRLCMTGVSAAEVMQAVDGFLADQGRSHECKRLRVVESS